jgi:succinoglycan biosynthesis protein ExoA
VTRCAVVLPCRNEEAHIAAVLDALAGQSRLPDELVIVNDGSTDRTAHIVRAWQQAHPALPLRVIDGPGRGPGPAMNAGIRETSADIIMRIDGHAVPATAYLEHCLDSLSDPAIGVVGGVWHVKPRVETTVARAIAAVVSHPIGSGGAQYRQADGAGPERVAVETVPFGTFRRSLWATLGGFDEALAANQDFDFNYRARATGVTVLLDRRVRATYFPRPTLGALARQYFRYGFWKVQMLRKDTRALHLRQLPPAGVLLWIVGTTVAALVWPGWLTGLAAALYPVVAAAGAVHVGVARRVNPLAAFAAIVVVHLCWSAGFLKGVVTR